jgi:hypothetical protein
METFTVHVLEARGKNSPVVQAALDLVQLSDGPIFYRYHEWTMPEASDVLPIDRISKKIKNPERFSSNCDENIIQESSSRTEFAFEKRLEPDPYSWLSEGTYALKHRLEIPRSWSCFESAASATDFSGTAFWGSSRATTQQVQ